MIAARYHSPPRLRIAQCASRVTERQSTGWRRDEMAHALIRKVIRPRIAPAQSRTVGCDLAYPAIDSERSVCAGRSDGSPSESAVSSTHVGGFGSGALPPPSLPRPGSSSRERNVPDYAINGLRPGQSRTTRCGDAKNRAPAGRNQAVPGSRVRARKLPGEPPHPQECGIRLHHHDPHEEAADYGCPRRAP